MPGYLFDRVCETSTTTGTGDITLAGAIVGFQAFTDAVGGGYVTFSYLVEVVDTNGVATGDWEAGIGTLSSFNIMQRLAVTASSNSAALVDFAAGTKRVHLAATAASALNIRGCALRRSSDLTAQDLTTATAIPFNSLDWTNEPTGDVFHSNVTNPARITLPSNYTWSRMRLSGQVAFANITAGDWVELKIRISGGSVPVGRATAYVPTATCAMQVSSIISSAGDADYFELFAQVGADTSVDIKAWDTWFQLEVIQ